MTVQKYFDELVKATQKHTTEIFPSVALAQAILESGLFSNKGPSGLATKYNNFFGIKASTSWKGAVTPALSTQEDDGKGNMSTIQAGFRAYPSIEASVKDHNDLFKTDFSKSYYAKVINAKTPGEQTQALQGTYATDSAYASKLNNIISQYNLTQYDKNRGVSDAERVLSIAKSYLGVKKYSTAHAQLVKDYNSIKPLPVGYAVTNHDDYCDIGVTVVFDKAGLSHLIGRECGVERHKAILKSKGIWLGLTRPKRGDVIIFKWNGDRNGFADHIGLVEAVSGDNITTIEFNTLINGVSQVANRNYRWEAQTIQGYARPKYANTLTTTPTPTTPSKPKMTFEQTVQAVIAGKMGNGQDRVSNIKNEGHDPVTVQNEVNKRLAPKPKMTFEQVVQAVITGKFGNGEDRKKKIRSEGHDPNKVQAEVNKRLAPKMTFEQVVQAVIVGKMGNGEDRKTKIRNEGHDPAKVQSEVNKRLAPKPKKSKEQVVREVIRGLYGNGQVRRDKLTKEGFNADEIQRMVDKAL